jgi:hypothetical protein
LLHHPNRIVLTTVDRVLLFWRSRALSTALDTEQLAGPRPEGLNPVKVKRFPILGEAIYLAIAQGEHAGCLNAFIPTMKIYLRSLTGATLKPTERPFIAQVTHRSIFTDEQAKPSGAKDATGRAFIISIMSTIQCATALTERYPRMSTSWPVS